MHFEGAPMTDSPGSSLLNQNGGGAYDYAWKNHPKIGITVVSGSGPNFAGHALLRVKAYATGLDEAVLKVDGTDARCHGHSFYYHVPLPGRTTPLYLDGHKDMNKYLDESGKTVIGTIWLPAHAGNPSALLNQLLRYAHGHEKYSWIGAYHNCWSFAIELAKKARYATPSFGAAHPKTPIQLLRKVAENNQSMRVEWGPASISSP